MDESGRRRRVVRAVGLVLMAGLLGAATLVVVALAGAWTVPA